ncbi:MULTISPECIES: hypothetical protein [Kitasatospora]|uniref:hypothetical protein n=1 Tax=Kitasatospora TaxID=2063 RepID=UPI000C71427F|nr:hypothetical protein [Kitasatospora sp. GP30]MDH6138842.1 hypothetical protein [Kitasatospora sp. GP30]
MPSFDENLTQVLREAAELAPDVPGAALVDPAERRGRRLRARRRAALASGAAVLLAAGLTATALRPGGATAPVSAAASTAHSGVSDQSLDEHTVLATLSSLLPPGRFSDVNSGLATGLGPAVSLDYDTGHAAARLQIATNRRPMPLTQWTNGTQCPDPFSVPIAGCSRSTQPDGSVLVVERQPADTPEGTAVVYTGADGRQLRISEAPPRTIAHPEDRLLTDDQLAAVAASPMWAPSVAKLTATDPKIGPEPTPEQVVAAATRLLPTEATKVVDTSKQVTPGTGHLAVTLNGRTSMVSITVLPGFGKLAPDTIQKAFDEGARAHGNLTHAQGGTSVSIDSNGSGDTATTHGAQVDTLTTAGTRVTVAEWNGPNGYTYTGGPLALTTDQLTAIALGTDWSKP